MRTRFLLTLGIAMACSAGTTHVAAQSLDTLGIVDTLHFGRMSGSAGAHIKVPVQVTNDVECVSLTVPVAFPADGLQADSVTFSGGRMAHFGLLTQTIEQAQGRVLLAALQLGGVGLMPGTGPIAWLHFTIASDATIGEEFPIDTGYINEQGKLLFVAGANGTLTFLPAVASGAVSVVEPNKPPLFLATGTHTVREGDAVHIALAAEDPDGDPVHLTLLNRPPGATFQAGIFDWTVPYTGPYSSAQSPVTLTFAADDGTDLTVVDIPVTVINMNRPPVLVAADTVTSSAYTSLEWDVVATDPDLDPVSLTVSGVPAPAQVAPGNPLQIQWQPVQADTGFYPVTFRATDPNGGVTIVNSVLHIMPGNRVGFSIDTVSGFTDQDVTLTISMDNTEVLSGIELLIHLDPTAAVISDINRDGTRIEGWEMFAATQNYNGRPGDIHILARADINDGTPSPNLESGSGPIVSVHLRLISDEAYAGLSFPTRFVFHTATANTVMDAAGDPILQNEIAYSHGQVDILVNENRLIGDINLNGLAFEVGDVVYLANYFSNPALYPLDFEQRANSDVNRDGISASIADLVFMINVLTTGGAPKVAPVDDRQPAYWHVTKSGELWIDSDVPLGGMYLEYLSESSAELSAGRALSGMNLQSGHDAGVGRVLVYSMEGLHIDPAVGPICAGLKDVQISRLELADVLGFPRVAHSNGMLPERMQLLGNYPNPFNPQTAIRFAIASPGHVQIEIYNILGGRVAQIGGHFQPGEQELLWDGRDSAGVPVPSGVYFYRFEYEGKQEVKRMLLLK